MSAGCFFARHNTDRRDWIDVSETDGRQRRQSKVERSEEVTECDVHGLLRFVPIHSVGSTTNAQPNKCSQQSNSESVSQFLGQQPR